MPGDDLSGARRKPQSQLAQARVEGVVERRGQIGKVLDARRERVTRAVQAPLQNRSCLCGPSGLRSRRARLSHRGSGLGLP